VVSLLALFLVRSPAIEVVMIFLWGCSFGGLPTILQSATARIAGRAHAELATAMLTTVYNTGIFSGGALGGLVFDRLGAARIPLLSVSFIAAALMIILVNARIFSNRKNEAEMSGS
jgi:predicted MFS family arabinose efflux permease